MAELIAAALLLELVIGNQNFFSHPVVFIGKLISFLEKGVCRVFKTGARLRFGGLLLALFVILFIYLVTFLLIESVYYFNIYAGKLFEVFILSTTFAVRSLHSHSAAVMLPLKEGNLSTARESVSLVVGRDTQNMDEREVSRAVVETIGENTVDGIISPLFYAFIGGTPLAMAYKAVNTLDSMLGYTDGDYYYLGWASARIDDIANFIPARVTGFSMMLLAITDRKRFSRTFKALQEDAGKHPSPNSGIPEAGMAGLLGVRLGGVNYYNGVVSERPYMGEEVYRLSVSHIRGALRWMYAVTVLLFLFFALISKFI